MKMLKTLEAIIEQDGVVSLNEPIKLSRRSKALVTILEEVSEVDEAMMLSESALQDWNRPEENEACANLQSPRS